tara:strand:- start:799 stop:969 length:171 start_codon:yes stop_codon:yes gene_type:complete
LFGQRLQRLYREIRRRLLLCPFFLITFIQVDPKTMPARINTYENTITNNMFNFAYE